LANSLAQQVSSGSDLLKDLVNKKVSLRPSLKGPSEDFGCLPHATCHMPSRRLLHWQRLMVVEANKLD
jgi:hypothetical protein